MRATRRWLVMALAAALCVTGPAAVRAQEAAPATPITWTSTPRLPAAPLKPGDTFPVDVTATIDPGWHLYSMTPVEGGPRPTRITIAGDAFEIAGDIVAPEPFAEVDRNFGVEVEYYEKSATFTVPVRILPQAPPGESTLTVQVRFQTCNDRHCLPPTLVKMPVAVVVAAAGSGAAAGTPSRAEPPVATRTAASPDPPASPVAVTRPSAPAQGGVVAPAAAAPGPATGEPPPAAPGASSLALTADNASADRLKRSGLAGYIWFAMGFGLLALLTPCVFPMIPITVSFFTKREEQTRGAAVRQALVYCAGIIVSFTALGLLITLVAGPTGVNRLAANPWMNLLLTALFVVFALNLFGAFEIRLPSRLLSTLDAQSRRGSGLVPTLLMGLTFTLTSFTCTAAFVGTVLVAATQGEWTWAAIGMFAFATAFAAPFFLLALFPSWLHSLPKSGGWLNSVKVVMGFLEIAAAFKFLSNVDLVWGWNTVSRSVVLAAWVAIAAVTALYLLGLFRLPHDSRVEQVGVARMLSSVAFAALGVYLLTGLFGARLGELDPFLPPARPGELAFAMGNAGAGVSGTGASQQAAHGAWLESYGEGLARARAEQKRVFLNFTGVTCTNCRWMETNMFPDSDVQQALSPFVLVELFTDRETPGDEANGELQQAKFGTVALPLYAVVDAAERVIATFPGLTRDKAEFLRFLEAGASAPPSSE